MEERANHLTVVIGAAGIAEELRRVLVRRKVSHVGVAGHIRGLRRSMVVGSDDLIVVCIALDRSTLNRHGKALRQLLADQGCFPQTVRSVGLLTDMGLSRDAAEMGCDVYVDDSTAALKAVRSMTRRWSHDQSRRSTSRPRRQLALAGDDRSMWQWGMGKLPRELAPLLASASKPAARPRRATSLRNRVRRTSQSTRRPSSSD